MSYSPSPLAIKMSKGYLKDWRMSQNTPTYLLSFFLAAGQKLIWRKLLDLTYSESLEERKRLELWSIFFYNQDCISYVIKIISITTGARSDGRWRSNSFWRMDSADGSACRVSAVQHRPGKVTKLVDRIKLFSVVLIFPSFVPSLFPIISLTTVAINTNTSFYLCNIV